MKKQLEKKVLEKEALLWGKVKNALSGRDQGMPQVKELKRLNVAGSATEKRKKNFSSNGT